MIVIVILLVISSVAAPPLCEPPLRWALWVRRSKRYSLASIPLPRPLCASCAFCAFLRLSSCVPVPRFISADVVAICYFLFSAFPPAFCVFQARSRTVLRYRRSTAPNPVIARVNQERRSVRTTTTAGSSGKRPTDPVGRRGHFGSPGGARGHWVLFRFMVLWELGVLRKFRSLGVGSLGVRLSYS